MRKLIATLASAATMVVASVAGASTFTLNFDGSSTTSNPTHTGASGTVEFAFSDSGSNVLLTLTINNTTGDVIFGDGATQSMLTGFGFDLIQGVSYVSGSFFGDANINTLIEDASAQPFDNLDLAFADNGNYNGGNANGALAEGNSNTVSLLLNSTMDANTLMAAFYDGFTNFGLQAAMRFMQVNAGAGSDKLEFVEPVPVPGALVLMATGLAAAGAARRRARTA